jgi:hypothetical protein
MMTPRIFGIVTACMLTGALSASAQNGPDKDKGQGKADMPLAESGGSSANDEARDRSPNKDNKNTKSESPARAKSGHGDDKDNRADSQRPSGSSQKEVPKSELNKSADKAARDEKPGAKSAQKSEPAPREKSAEDAKSPAPSKDKSAEKDTPKSDSKGGDSASGTSTGESGNSAPGKVTEDKKKVDDVKRVQISGEKRDRVQAGFKSRGDVKHITNVNVSVSVGSRASRDWVFVPVPTTVIDIVPEYRGYVYAYVGDDYVVCDPATYEIVAVVPASGSGGGYASRNSGGGADKCSAELTLSEADRRDIIQSVEMNDEVKISGVSVGWSVPNDIEVRPLPPRVVERTSALSACRYFIVDDQIAIVDPDQDKVVLIIDHN